MELSTCFASPEIYYSLACFTYILSGVFGAIIRWCHMCILIVNKATTSTLHNYVNLLYNKPPQKGKINSSGAAFNFFL